MKRTPLLFINVLIIATCGLVYELVAGTLASYVLGDSVTQFSICIGVYLSALGVGAWLSGFVEQSERCFVEVELAVALLGGLSAPLLFFAFVHLSWFHLVLYGTVFGIGALVGLELPLLMRILRDRMEFKDLVSRVLTFDYIGALVGSLMFPIFLVPQLGLIRTSLLFGMLNGAVGLWGTWLLADGLRGHVLGLRFRGVLTLLLLLAAFVKADAVTTLVEDQIYPDPVVYSKTTRYQRMIVTRGQDTFRLYLNGNLQFSSADEYRYHEALVHPAAVLAEESGALANALVLGGGDGLAVREILKHPGVAAVTLVDLDPGMTQLSEAYRPLGELNAGSLFDPRVTIVNQDAMQWINRGDEQFDLIVIDFPDPNNFGLGKLYSRRFYRMLKRRLRRDGAVAVQCTSPLIARQSFWCIVNTMRAAGFSAEGYHVPVPSFEAGEWGFALAMHRPFERPRRAPPGLKYLNDATLESMFPFANDMSHVETEINRLDNQILVRYYDVEWNRWAQ